MILMMGPVIYGEGFLFARVQIVAVASLHSIVKFMFGDDNAGSCVFAFSTPFIVTGVFRQQNSMILSYKMGDVSFCLGSYLKANLLGTVHMYTAYSHSISRSRRLVLDVGSIFHKLQGLFPSGNQPFIGKFPTSHEHGKYMVSLPTIWILNVYNQLFT